MAATTAARKLTPAMRAALVMHDDATGQVGGATATLKALFNRGLVAIMENEYVITNNGRAALADMAATKAPAADAVMVVPVARGVYRVQQGDRTLGTIHKTMSIAFRGDSRLTPRWDVRETLADGSDRSVANSMLTRAAAVDYLVRSAAHRDSAPHRAAAIAEAQAEKVAVKAARPAASFITLKAMRRDINALYRSGGVLYGLQALDARVNVQGARADIVVHAANALGRGVQAAAYINADGTYTDAGREIHDALAAIQARYGVPGEVVFQGFTRQA